MHNNIEHYNIHYNTNTYYYRCI